MCITFILQIELYCDHPVTGESMSTFKVHKDELLPVVLDKAYEVFYLIFCCLFLFSQLMKLAPHIAIERCRLVKYNYENNVMHWSFDLDEVRIIMFYLFCCFNYNSISFCIKLLSNLWVELEFFILLNYS